MMSFRFSDNSKPTPIKLQCATGLNLSQINPFPEENQRWALLEERAVNAIFGELWCDEVEELVLASAIFLGKLGSRCVIGHSRIVPGHKLSLFLFNINLRPPVA